MLSFSTPGVRSLYLSRVRERMLIYDINDIKASFEKDTPARISFGRSNFSRRRSNFSRERLISSGNLLSEEKSSLVKHDVGINRETDMIYSVTPYQRNRNRARIKKMPVVINERNPHSLSDAADTRRGGD